MPCHPLGYPRATQVDRNLTWTKNGFRRAVYKGRLFCIQEAGREHSLDLTKAGFVVLYAEGQVSPPDKRQVSHSSDIGGAASWLTIALATRLRQCSVVHELHAQHDAPQQQPSSPAQQRQRLSYPHEQRLGGVSQQQQGLLQQQQ